MTSLHMWYSSSRPLPEFFWHHVGQVTPCMHCMLLQQRELLMPFRDLCRTRLLQTAITKMQRSFVRHERLRTCTHALFISVSLSLSLSFSLSLCLSLCLSLSLTLSLPLSQPLLCEIGQRHFLSWAATCSALGLSAPAQY